MGYESEIKKLERRWEENPKQYFAPLADLYRKNGDFNRALELITEGLIERPDYVSAHIVLGRTRVGMGEPDEAARVFEQVLEYDGENIIALSQLADLADQAGDTGGVIRWLGRLLEVDPMSDQAARLESLKESFTDGAEEGAGDDAPRESETEDTAALSFSDVMDEGPAAVAETEAAEPAEPLDEVAEGEGEHDATMPPALDELETVLDMQPVVEAPRISLDDLPTERIVAIGDEQLPAGDDAKIDTDDYAMKTETSEVSSDADESLEIAEIPTEQMAGITDEQLAETAVDETPVATDEIPAADAVEMVSAGGGVDVEESGSETVEAPPVVEATPAREPRISGPLDDIPVIMPEDLEPASVDPNALIDPSPAPVVTETMARVFAEQGMVSQAVDVYRKLVEDDPANDRIRAELERLKALPLDPAPEATSSPRHRYSVLDTGGQSARHVLRGLLASHIASRKAPVPREPFTGPNEAPTSSSRLSFDDFYGASSSGELPEAEEPAETENDDFKNWLKGLKS